MRLTFLTVSSVSKSTLLETPDIERVLRLALDNVKAKGAPDTHFAITVNGLLQCLNDALVTVTGNADNG